MDLTNTEIWDIAANILHNKSYKETYVQILSKVIKDKHRSILDTACGTGFPSIMLHENGFHNIVCMDADKDELNLFNKRLQKSEIDLEVIQGQWQTINTFVKNKYDVLLNVDSALGYMDTWLGDKIKFSKNNVFNRISLVLKNFYSLLNENGVLIIGIPQNNIKTNKSLIHGIGQGSYNGKQVKVRWLLSFDWSNRIKTWDNEITIGNDKNKRNLKSYLFTKEELKNLMEKIGFKKVKIVSEKGLYDDIVVGYK